MNVMDVMKNLVVTVLSVLTLTGCNLTTPEVPGVNTPAAQVQSQTQTTQQPVQQHEQRNDDNLFGLNKDDIPIPENVVYQPVTGGLKVTASKVELNIPDYAGEVKYIVNNDIPCFTEKERVNKKAFETYSPLDSLGRCGVAYANICKELMPTEARGEIGSVKPSGWHTAKYDCVEGKYLYNRCHLIGFQLAGENANEKNLITGTRYLNIQGMLDEENMIAEYVRKTGNHVLYRVTPVFAGDELVCRGLLLEAWSVEDNGKGVCFCRFSYNVQPGVGIDYMTGESWLLGEENLISPTPIYTVEEPQIEYILNTSSKKYHLPSCSSAEKILEKNKEIFNGPISWLKDNDYTACGYCKP